MAEEVKLQEGAERQVPSLANPAASWSRTGGGQKGASPGAAGAEALQKQLQAQQQVPAPKRPGSSTDQELQGREAR
jgi:hypothetical protein